MKTLILILLTLPCFAQQEIRCYAELNQGDWYTGANKMYLMWAVHFDEPGTYVVNKQIINNVDFKKLPYRYQFSIYKGKGMMFYKKNIIKKFNAVRYPATDVFPVIECKVNKGETLFFSIRYDFKQAVALPGNVWGGHSDLIYSVNGGEYHSCSTYTILK